MFGRDGAKRWAECAIFLFYIPIKADFQSPFLRKPREMVRGMLRPLVVKMCYLPSAYCRAACESISLIVLTTGMGERTRMPEP